MEENPTESMLRRMKNLRMFKGWTDNQIIEYLKSRPPKEQKEIIAAPKATVPSETLSDYEKDFQRKLKTLQKEYIVDMNDANDAESLRSLVRFMLQLEVIDTKIRDFYETGSTNTKALKDMGDYQRSLQMSVADLQNNLGVSRRIRKEKTVDDIPKYIAGLQEKAKLFWERKTIVIKCDKDKIELARYWLNFPNLDNEASFELECWKCHTRVIYNL